MKYLKYSPVLTSIIIFIFYLFTLAPSVIQIDSGELAAVQITAGIAHPTGYPLFTILGFIWSHIPLPFTDILKMNLLAALLCSIAAGIFVSTSVLLLKKIEITHSAVSKKNKGKKKDNVGKPVIIIPEYLIYASAVAGALVLAFSRTFWFQSTSVEVYSLHLVLVILIIHLLIKAYYNSSDAIADRYWLIFAIVLALGFSNHMTTILILPAAAFMYFRRYGFNKRAFLRLGYMIILFIPLLILLYSYLPIRSGQNPVINWGHPVDLEKILWHISGKQYQTWLFSSTESAKKQFVYFFSNLPAEFGFSLIVTIVGLFVSYRLSRIIFLFLVILFLSTVFYSINYDIVDIDSYFLLAYTALAFFSAFGFLQVFRSVKNDKIIYAAAGLLLIHQVYLNYSDVNQSGNYAFEDYTKSVLKSVTKNSIIFGYQWDFLISPSYYFQFADGFRNDVKIIDKELLRRSWYYNQLNNNYPDVMKDIKAEIKVFTSALVPFEKGEVYDPELLERSYRQLMTRLVETNIDERDFYITPELVENEMAKGHFTLPKGYSIVPDIFCFKVVKGNEYVPASDPNFILRIPENKNNYLNSISLFTGSMLARRALYEMQFDKRERALVYINKIKKDFPDYPLPPALAAALN